MPRKPLPVGTWGKIRRQKLGPSRFAARARFRDFDGITRDVQARDATAAAAEHALLEALRDRAAPTGDDVTPDTRLTKLADLWLDEITTEGRITQQTIDDYEQSVHSVILPALGGLRIREARVSRIDRFFKTIAATHPSKARIARTVLNQMIGMAVRHDALAVNPVRDIGRLPKKRRRVRAIDIGDLHKVRAAIRRWQTGRPGRPGPRHTDDLADIVEMLLATGGRIGEVLAFRWIDLDLTAQPATATFSGTLVYIKGMGTVRQPWTKSDAGYRTVLLPAFALTMLQRRRAKAGDDLEAGVFLSRRGTWLPPHNIRRQWREARRGTGLEWVTPHTFRKTVATLLDREANTKAAASQLGHNSEDITTTYYVEKARVAPDMTKILAALGDGEPRRRRECEGLEVAERTLVGNENEPD
ncbi:MAG: tyrosine-type recombinase/integrase [Micromonosporaceae bacterium]|nr:tyrosine-type recombinase/integrase [Micromonosporaceae bacterium]